MLLCVAALLLNGVALPANGSIPTPAARVYLMDNTPSREEARAFLARLGVTPESACAAGVNVSDVEPLVQSAVDTLDTLRPSIEAADAAVSTARAQLALARSTGGGQPGVAPQAAVEQAEAAVSAATASQSLLLSSAFDSATAPIQGVVRTRLATIRANQDQCVPVEFKVIVRTAAEWRALQGALKHIQSRQACGLAAAPDRAAVVTSAAVNPEVALAKVRLDSLLQQVRAAWFTAAQP